MNWRNMNGKGAKAQMIKLTYRSFGLPVPDASSGIDGGMRLLLCTIFVVVALAITVVLNFFSLLAGVLITFLGRDGAQFKFLMLFNRIPVIAIALPILLGYAIWHQSVGFSGLVHLLLPMVLVWILAAILLIALSIIGKLQH